VVPRARHQAIAIDLEIGAVPQPLVALDDTKVDLVGCSGFFELPLDGRAGRAPRRRARRARSAHGWRLSFWSRSAEMQGSAANRGSRATMPAGIQVTSRSAFSHRPK
jgi:hypothetical protein